MKFRDIVGQDQPCRLLQREWQRHRVSHAYLFHGPNQVGKTTAAVAFAQLLNCQIPDVSHVEPCDACDTCIRIRENRFVDMQTIRPRLYAERRSWGDSGEERRHIELPPLAPEYMDDSIISIDVVRDFLSSASYRPVAGRQRVYIFCEAEKMNFQAQNCILKTLEEPVAHVTIILITQHTGELLPTLVSRCHRVRFGPVPESQICDLLKRHTALDDTTIQFIASLAGGKPGWALRTARHGIVLEHRRQVFGFVERLVTGEIAEALTLAEQASAFAESLWLAEKEDGVYDTAVLNDSTARSRILRSSQAEFLEILAGWFRDLLLAQLNDCDLAIIHPQSLDWLRRAASSYTRADLVRSVEQIHQTRRQILANANGHLALEVLFLNLFRNRKRIM